MGTIDYSNSNKSKEPGPTKPEPTKVISGDVARKKQPLGTKFRSVFLGADAKGVMGYVVTDVLIPGARDMFFDMITKGAGRMAYGERGGRAGMGLGGMRTNYAGANRAVKLETVPFGQRLMQQAPQPAEDLENYLLGSREDVEAIIDSVNEWIRMYDVITQYDVKKMLGIPAAHTDNKWGWTSLAGAGIKQTRDGWIMQLPSPKLI